MSDEVAMKVDRTIVPCGLCGSKIHDYAAKVACLLPTNSKPRDEFVCEDCYKRWRDGELDG